MQFVFLSMVREIVLIILQGYFTCQSFCKRSFLWNFIFELVDRSFDKRIINWFNDVLSLFALMLFLREKFFGAGR